MSSPDNTPLNLLRVVPTARARRDRLKDQSGLATRILTMGELESRLVVVPDRTLIDETTGLLLLKEAADDPLYEKLGIAPDFLVFLEHGPFFQRFFEELALEGVAPEALLQGDHYAEYGEHITLLSHLRERYLALLQERGLADRIVQCHHYRLNAPYLEQFDRIEIEIEGHLSRFERSLLQAASQVVPVHLTLHLSPFDTQTIERFAPLPLRSGHSERIDLATGTLLESTLLPSPDAFGFYQLGSRLEQCGALLHAIYRLVDEGTPPERIAVVLPDESLAPFLRQFDTHRIFNFAMGEPFSQRPLYLRLSALYERLNSEDPAVCACFERLSVEHPDFAALAEPFFDLQPLEPAANLAQLGTLAPLAGESELPILQEALHAITPLIEAAGQRPAKEALYLLLGELKTQSLDDVGGGPVTVLGVLETRGVSFDAVLVPDFNEGYAPKESIKDLFLSSAVRAVAGLPTRADRADLQRSLYWRLFSRTPIRKIFCVQSDQAQPSRFAKELGILTAPEPYRFDKNLLYPAAALTQSADEPIELSVNLCDRPLYPHQLKSYLTCRRQYYYRYLRKLRGGDALAPMAVAREFGTLLHDLLKELYSEQTFLQDPQPSILTQALAKKSRHDRRLTVEARIWSQQLASFCALEEKRLAHGWRPVLLEGELRGELDGVLLAGRIDRIDRLDDELLVLDYKTGKLPKLDKIEQQVDFQLAFYALLGRSLPHESLQAAYYDLSGGELVYLEDAAAHIEALRAHLALFKAPRQRFDRCESFTPCRRCEYATLCDRSL